jgi:hypothetical protein
VVQGQIKLKVDTNASPPPNKAPGECCLLHIKATMIHTHSSWFFVSVLQEMGTGENAT